MRTSRRRFLETASGAAVVAGGMEWLTRLRPVSAEEAALPTSRVKMGNGVEATVKLLEDTPREKLIEEVATRVKRGLPYQELLAALLLAGVRNVQPRPQVGFKFHAVLVINSAHLASMASANEDRWLPIFWALDKFKASQIETQKSSGWKMGAVDESKVPAGSKAKEAFVAAMDNWDEEAADAAAAGVARSIGRDQAFELFARYGARDFRDIGHKAIYVANSFRTLEAIGWHHAEPVLRSLAYALLKREAENPAKADLPPDRPGRRNAELVKKIRPDWQDGKRDDAVTARLLAGLRSASDEESCAAVVEAINAGASAEAVWDAILSGAGELLMRKTSIVTLHSVTSANALRFTYGECAHPETRLMMLLQAAAFLPLFRGAAGKLSDSRLDEIETADATDAASVFADKDRPSAARKALGYLKNNGDARELMHVARRMVFLKGNDAHDYKYSSAVLEDYDHVSPALRDRFLATSLYYLPNGGSKDNPIVARIREALA